MALTTDSQDTLWLCTALKGVMTWDGKAVSRFEEQGDIGDKACQSIFTDSQGRVWIGMLTAGVAVYEKGDVPHLRHERRTCAAGSCSRSLEDDKGGVWLSTSAGVSRYSERTPHLDHASQRAVDGSRARADRGSRRLHLGRRELRRRHDSLPSSAKWTRSRRNPAHQLEYALYDESDGMQQGSQTWQSGVGGVRGGDGRLWVATGLGMTVIDPRQPSADATAAAAAHRERHRRWPAASRRRVISRCHQARRRCASSTAPSACRRRRSCASATCSRAWTTNGCTPATCARRPTPTFRPATTASGSAPRPTASGPRRRGGSSRSRRRSIERASSSTLSLLGLMLILAAAWWLRLRAVRNQYALVFAERARVSREIHDTLLQSLAAIGVELETIATELDAVAGSRARRPAPSSPSGRALPARGARVDPRAAQQLDEAPRARRRRCVSWRRTRRKTEGHPHRVLDHRPSAARRSADADMQLLRIAQESVNNAVRHGRPRSCASRCPSRTIGVRAHRHRRRLRLRAGRSRSGARSRRAPRTAHDARARRALRGRLAHHQQPWRTARRSRRRCRWRRSKPWHGHVQFASCAWTTTG